MMFGEQRWMLRTALRDCPTGARIFDNLLTFMRRAVSLAGCIIASTYPRPVLRARGALFPRGNESLRL